MKSIRRSLSILCLAAAVAASLGWVTPVSASVPGAAFTETGCEGSSDSVARLYSAGLGRDPELEGFEFWLKEYTAGRQTFRSMAAFFADSPEFGINYGSLSDEEFVKQIYRNILGREGDAGGIAFWSGELGRTATRATILMRFAESPENIAKSGTSSPTLGQFNEGRSVRWTCAGWQPSGGFADTTSNSCVATGRNILGSTDIRMRLTNSTATRATATVLIEGMVDGVRRDDQYAIVYGVEPGETVEEDSILLDAVFDSPVLESVTCGFLSVDWDPETDFVRSTGGCSLDEENVLGFWDIEIGAANPLGVTADAVVAILPYVDGRRVAFQFSTFSDVAPGSQAFRQSVILSSRAEGVDASRLRCDLMVLSWEPST